MKVHHNSKCIMQIIDIISTFAPRDAKPSILRSYAGSRSLVGALEGGDEDQQ